MPAVGRSAAAARRRLRPRLLPPGTGADGAGDRQTAADKQTGRTGALYDPMAPKEGGAALSKGGIAQEKPEQIKPMTSDPQQPVQPGPAPAPTPANANTGGQGAGSGGAAQPQQ